MTRWLQRAGLDVAEPIVDFAEETLRGAGLEAASFWTGLAELIRELTPRNRALLAERDRLQRELDGFHTAHPGQPDPDAYRSFLVRIGYLVDEPAGFAVTTTDVDAELATMAAPQLVVPMLNARFAVNAANARWGSLYDALYGTDAIPEDGGRERAGSYNPLRGRAVVDRGRAVLDQAAPLARGSHADARGYRIEDGRLLIELAEGAATDLADETVFAGFTGDASDPDTILLGHHGLHLEIVRNRDRPVGAADPAGIDDIVLEAAVTTILDLEDSVAAVDAEDKALGYRNWRGLMEGTLEARVDKPTGSFTRTLNADRTYTTPSGGSLTLHGRSLLLVRNVGHLMTTDAAIDADGAPVFEGILDAVMTSLGALVDVRRPRSGGNSRTGSIYIVKPKMHGPDEVRFAVDLFARVEELLGLPPRTLKIGIMDEERRTTVNLRAALAQAPDRVVFINTGFLDRTGDEIHTSMHAGAMLPKELIRAQPFLQAYEAANVDAGLAAGLPGHGQIGKGMWAMPDLMHDMLEQKIAHPRAGASTAWVPSPTAATLHALHYHEVDVHTVQHALAQRERAALSDILRPPLLDTVLSRDEIRAEVDTNVQSILGYVVRWIDQGIGCSKVPDLDGLGLMEDRATLRISSQLLANWLLHGVIETADIDDAILRLAPVVDGQNAGDTAYRPLLSGGEPGLAAESARRLILEGAAQPNGYTEPILHEMRRRRKASVSTP